MVLVLHAFLGDNILDHRLAGIELQLSKQQKKSESTSHRNYGGLNLDNFRKEFNNSNTRQRQSRSIYRRWNDKGTR